MGCLFPHFKINSLEMESLPPAPRVTVARVMLGEVSIWNTVALATFGEFLIIV